MVGILERAAEKRLQLDDFPGIPEKKLEATRSRLLEVSSRATPDFGLQTHFWAPPVYGVPADADALPCNPIGISQPGPPGPAQEMGKSPDPLAVRCGDALWLRGQCREHGLVRFHLTACKRRECEVCGPVRRMEKAMEIAYGVRRIMAAGGWCAWLVLTFDTPFAGEPGFKTTAVKRVAKFIQWLRTECGMPELQYAQTWELQASGRLHVNLVAGPWKYVRHAILLRRWGARVSVERVQDAGGMGVEAAAAYNPEALAGYLNKLSQAVPRDWGRGISFSKGWPRMPKDPLKRRGEISWKIPESGQLELFWMLRDRGRAIEVAPVEWAFAHSLDPECKCFEQVAPSRGPPGVRTTLEGPGDDSLRVPETTFEGRGDDFRGSRRRLSRVAETTFEGPGDARR